MRKVLIIILCLLCLTACQRKPSLPDISKESRLPVTTESTEDTMDNSAIRDECIRVGDMFLADLFNFGDVIGYEDQAYWESTLRYTIYDSLDDLMLSPYISCGFDATGEKSGKAKAYVLNYLAERAEITPGEIDFIDEDKIVELSYDLVVIPGRDAFQALDDADLLNWFAQWYDNALPSVTEVLDQMEPVQTSFVITFQKTKQGYLVQDYPNTIGNRIFSISKDQL